MQKRLLLLPPPLRGRSIAEAESAGDREGGQPQDHRSLFTPLANPPSQGGREFTLRAAALAILAASLFFVSAASAQQPRTFTPTDESPDDLPGGDGREETFYACTACHGFKIVAQQGMTRTQWDDSLSWMTKRHGMNPLEGADRKLILDYLETHYPPSAPAGGRGSPNPFLK